MKDVFPEPNVEYICSQCCHASDDPDSDECGCRKHHTIIFVLFVVLCMLFVIVAVVS